MIKLTVSSILAGYLIDLFVFPVMNDNSTLIPVLVGISTSVLSCTLFLSLFLLVRFRYAKTVQRVIRRGSVGTLIHTFYSVCKTQGILWLSCIWVLLFSSEKSPNISFVLWMVLIVMVFQYAYFSMNYMNSVVKLLSRIFKDSVVASKGDKVQ